MRLTSPRRFLVSSLATVLALGLLVSSVSAGAAPGDESAHAAEAGFSAPSFLGVAGVDVRTLGYTGPDLGALDLAAVGAPLPTGFVARGRVVGSRLDALGPQRRGLATVVPLLEAAVRNVNPRIGRQRRRIALSAERLELATARLVETRDGVHRRQRALEAHRTRMGESVVAIYVHPPGADSISGIVDGIETDPGRLAAPVLQEAKIEHDLEIEDRLEVALATMVAQEAVQAEQVEALAAARERAEGWLAHLENTRATLGMARERARARRQTVEARVQWLHDELDALAHVLFQIDSGTPAWARQLVDVPLRKIGDFRVHVAVSHRLESMLAAARADGIALGGWGHRSHQRQIELRRAHCGESEEDVWQKPSGQCSPPTARPGRSLHELGLAVDFTHEGRTITSRRSVAYRWLAVHAPLYGFVNLPSEPWHWSLTGR